MRLFVMLLYPQASKQLVRRYLKPKNLPKRPSQQLFGRPGYDEFHTKPIRWTGADLG